jgi:hypothetical protein
MGIVISLLAFTAGAIMRFAVTVKGNGFDMHTAGNILMFVGVAGIILSVVYWASWGGFGGVRPNARNTHETVVRETEVG